MEQLREETHQQEQPPNPLKCPRCNSLDTKFRYFNNKNPRQPRYHCKTCERQWTVGGNLRNIPIGGKPGKNKQRKHSSSISTNPPPQPSHALTPVVPQNFNDEISCLDVILSLIQPDGSNQSMASQQVLPQQISRYVESYQTHNQVNNATQGLYDNSLAQPTWPMNYLPEGVTDDNLGLSTSNSCQWNNFIGSTSKTNAEMDTTPVNVDEWLNFLDYDSS